MHLEFNNKKTDKEILNKANQFLFNKKIIDTNKSLLLYGDNFCGLSFLLKNGYKNSIDLVYIDPPFNTNQKYFISQNKCNAISKNTNGFLAYNDNLSIDEYLEFMRERFVLIYNLLSDKGSLYVHTDIKMGHYLKILLDEIFGIENFKNDITRIKSNPKNFDRRAFGNEKDMILFYSKNNKKNIWNNVRMPLNQQEIDKLYPKIDKVGRYTTIPLHAPGTTLNGVTGKEWRGLLPPEGRHWRTDPNKFDIMDSQGLIEWSSTGNPRIKKYLKDHKGKKVQDIWKYKDPQYPNYPTQKNQKMIEFIINQSSSEDSIVLDCFAGGGTTLFACENTNRKWIGIDQSDQSINIIKNNLNPMTNYDYIDLNQICY